MDVYERIKKDHDAARELMKAIGATSAHGAEERRKLFNKFKLDLWAHHKIEEAVFYSYLRDNTVMSGEAYEALNEHHIANGLIEELDTFPQDSEEWGEKFKAMSEIVDHHISEEEDDFFPKARDVIAEDIAKRMGEEFDKRKKTTMQALKPMQAKDFEAA